MKMLIILFNVFIFGLLLSSAKITINLLLLTFLLYFCFTAFAVYDTKSEQYKSSKLKRNFRTVHPSKRKYYNNLVDDNGNDISFKEPLI